jgi:uncharacterized membrane protein
MIIAARSLSQVLTHMGIAFAVMFALTGSLAFGGLVAIVEPVVNVMLLPLHQMTWAWARARRARNSRHITMLIAAEKISQIGMHMAVAFAVIYWATGSLAFGGLAAILEPVCNVIVLPFHDRVWGKLGRRLRRQAAPKIVYL